MHTPITMTGNNILQNFICENKYNKESPFGIPPTARFRAFMTAYSRMLPDLIALQECDEGWHDLIDGGEGLPSLGYAAVTDGFSDEPLRMIRNPLYYKAERFSVEAAWYQMYDGTNHGDLANPWCFSCAILKDKESGLRFLASSTHLIWVSLENFAQRDAFAKQLSRVLSEIADRESVPVVAMGDYNAHIREPAYATMKQHFLSAREVDCEKHNMEYRTTNRLYQLPVPDITDGMGFIDHCFISKSGIVPLRYETLIGTEYCAYTDHAPQRFTFTLSSPQG